MFEPKKFTAVGAEIIRRLAAGQKNIDIARDMDVDADTVSYWRCSKLGEEKIKELTAEHEDNVKTYWDELDDLNALAISIIRAKLEQIVAKVEADEPLKHEEVRIAERHLERQGFTQPTRVDVRHQHLASQKVIEGIKKAKARLIEDQPKQIPYSGEPLPQADSDSEKEIE